MVGAELVLSYIIYERTPVLTHNARFICRGPELVCLERAMNLSLNLPDPRYQMVDLTGAWCRERYVDYHGLHQRVQNIYNMRGHGSHQFNPFICLKRPDVGKDSGEVTSINLVYSGNSLARAEVNTMEMIQVATGIHPEGFDWPLCPGEESQTPEAVMVYSGDDLNDMGQVFRQFYRTRFARGHWRDRERPILISNQKTTFMDFDEDKILLTTDKAKELGIELFILDDRWFGKRDDDTAFPGDQYPNLYKLPDGVAGLAGKIRDMKMKFGLWLGPGMVSRDSHLHRARPDWTLGDTGQSVYTGRYQYVLGSSKDRVVEYIGDRIEEILGDGGVSYAKWGVNGSISDLFSTDRDAQYQGTVYHKQVPGVYKLYGRLTRSFPHVPFESCTSGGTKFDPGILYHAPQG